MLIPSGKAVAHVRVNKDGFVEEEQFVVAHLEAVAKMAGDFGSVFGARDWAYLIGALHDLGKVSPGWQKALREKLNYDLESFAYTDESKGNHSTLGAVAMQKNDKLGRTGKIIAYAVAGHHAGLPDWEPGEGACLIERLFDGNINAGISKELKEKLEAISLDSEIKQFLTSLPPPKSPPLSRRRDMQKRHDNQALHLWIRMLFSCVVDADYLDTERFMNAQKYEQRANYDDLATLNERLKFFMHKKSIEAKRGIVNDIRANILAECMKKAAMKPGIYTLSVPTGAGKTLASMSFALEHATLNGQKRVIVAIPYTSIIEQTAKVYKYGTDDDEKIVSGEYRLFGEENVVEHHSNADPEKENKRNLFATENWDAPIIVTTNVQLFESLAGSRPSVCRKLHNIANSVIILDEVQMLPPEYLLSILRNLEHLVEYFGVTVLLCTATQPAFAGSLGEGSDAIRGLDGIVEIYDSDRKNLFESLKRVEFSIPSDEDRYEEWHELAEELAKIDRVLCVVNTRLSARELHTEMPEGTFHLSALMCGEDRSDVITLVKRALKSDGPVRLVSTQLIEAGVDVDFPVVYRAFAGLDSIAQSAGRCNREGSMSNPGSVVIFNPPVGSPPGLLRKGEETARAQLFGHDSFDLSDELFQKYFRRFFGKIRSFDKPEAAEFMLHDTSDLTYQFRTYANGYHLIDDKDQRAIIVPYSGEFTKTDSAVLIKQLERRCDYALIRRLQRFTVNVSKRVYDAMFKNGMLRFTSEGNFATLVNPKHYVKGFGLLLDDDAYEEVLLI